MILSHRKTRAYSLAILLAGLASLIFFNSMWPWILVVIGVTLAFHSYALGMKYEAFLNIFIFSLLTVVVKTEFYWNTIVPVILVLVAIFEFYKALQDDTELSTQERLEDTFHELEEKK